MKKNKVISVTMGKGGVGKTSFALALAQNLANKGKKTLLLDLDIQGNASSSLAKGNTVDVGILRYFAKNNFTDPETGKNREMVPSDVIYQSEIHENLFFIPNEKRVDGDKYSLSDILSGLSNSQQRITKFLNDKVFENFDYTIIDLPPSNDNSVIYNSMIAATYNPFNKGPSMGLGVLMPVASSDYGVDGVNDTFDLIVEINEGVSAYNNRLDCIGLVIPKYDKRTRGSKECLEYLEGKYGDLLIKPVVPTYEAINTMIQNDQSFLDFKNKKGRCKDVADAYSKITDQILERANMLIQSRISETSKPSMNREL
jgi:chromosome partitioning protein